VRRIHGSPDWFAEAYIEGWKLNLALLGGADGSLVLPAAEIPFDRYPPGKPLILGYGLPPWQRNPGHLLRRS
jgi:hypothetical protein